MGQTTHPKETAPLSQGQVSALIRLLPDDDPAIYQVVREKLLAQGTQARDWLKPHLLSNDPLLRRRVSEITRCLDRQVADNEFLAFCLNHGDDLELETGIWLLARTRYPEVNAEAYTAILDDYARILNERIDAASVPSSILGTVNNFLFDELGFGGNQEHYYDPDNSYLNRVIDRRTGNPISLCVVYLLVCRRLKLPVAGIGMPGHFLCRFQSSTDEIYIDAFNRGRLLRRADCVKYLLQSTTGFHESLLAPTSSRRIIQRVCANLLQIHHQANQQDETARVQRYIVALAK